ncbi:MAG TPA: serine hydrolase domain-containing protein [Kofleriaceae bacterium]|jgi:CubicO group peptidase (beta-lactamase class C family)
MSSRIALVALLAACGSTPQHDTAPGNGRGPATDSDPDGPHRGPVAAQVQPLVDGQVVSAIVIGLYDAGHDEIYGFGKGPHGAPPNGHTLFELGGLTKIYTGLLFADAVQRKELDPDADLADLLPPGVTSPTRDGATITLRELALDSAGMPRMPPSVVALGARPDPYGDYSEDRLYADLVHTQLETKPGTQVTSSTYGAGLLGFVIGRKLGTGYARAVETRVLAPLGLHDTFVDVVPPAAAPRRAAGTSTDLAPVLPWRWSALAGGGGLISDARDQLALLAAALDSPESRRPLHGALKFALEPALDHEGQNEGLGWEIDSDGRYWQAGGTGGFHAFIGFDPKTRRGFVILAATSNTIIEQLAGAMTKILRDEPVPAPVMPTAAQLAALAGHYELSKQKLTIAATGNRLYLEADTGKLRLVPISDHEFWIEELQTVAVFERDGDKIARLVFVAGPNQLTAARVD